MSLGELQLSKGWLTPSLWDYYGWGNVYDHSQVPGLPRLQICNPATRLTSHPMENVKRETNKAPQHQSLLWGFLTTGWGTCPGLGL